ncbi:hypothetical protein [Actinoallomurus iriomotensis]|uniref:Uncharacterized protein n=1 Tax=Actinoallomurus iriomotensis TaxID=478107 RepID=A0A9W6S5X3_9ACTN|nr:hypothetical protein [Actinoallomurus iriomotensis]GLY87659.1 hypothetical protein Airi02_055880 [Actinoallomurus iriomotensis]
MAERAVRKTRKGTVVEVPVLGAVTLPPRDRLIFYAGLGVLAAFEVVEWPVAMIVGVGHMLADQRHWRAGQEAGEAMEQA